MKTVFQLVGIALGAFMLMVLFLYLQDRYIYGIHWNVPFQTINECEVTKNRLFVKQ